MTRSHPEDAPPRIDPRWRVVVISTHFDDAVLSVGGYLDGTHAPKAVATVHGGAPGPAAEVSGWDLDCGFPTASEAYTTRLEEDRRACAALRADQVALPNPDNPYREAGPLGGLRPLLEGLGDDVDVLLPLGTNQPDHTAARDAALEVLGTLSRRPPLIYADLPYAAALVTDWRHAPAAELEATLAEHDPRYRDLRDRFGLELLHSSPVPQASWSRKRQAIFHYASQLSLVGAMGEVRHLGAMMRFPGIMQRELIWRLGGT